MLFKNPSRASILALLICFFANLVEIDRLFFSPALNTDISFVKDTFLSSGDQIFSLKSQTLFFATSILVLYYIISCEEVKAELQLDLF